MHTIEAQLNDNTSSAATEDLLEEQLHQTFLVMIAIVYLIPKLVNVLSPKDLLTSNILTMTSRNSYLLIRRRCCKNNRGKIN